MSSQRTRLKKLRGIIPPLATPLLDYDRLDSAGLEKLVEHVIAGGVHGIFILGTTGEGPSLGYGLRRRMIKESCHLAAGRIPVLVGITDTAFAESARLADHAAECGAEAVVLAPPYYMPEGQPELREYLSHLLPKLSLPLVLYNMPPLTKVSFEMETVLWAMEQDGIAGMKDSSGNMAYFNSLLEQLGRREDWFLLMGPEEQLAASVLMGGHGGVSGGANIFPSLYVALHKAASTGDLAKTRRLHSLVMSVSDKLYHVGKHSSSIIKGIKCALSCLGVCGDFMAEPFRRFQEPERQRIQRAIDELMEQLRAKSLV